MTFLTMPVFASVNYWAVLVAALLSFFLGGLWYSPVLFEQIWMSSNGYSEAQVKQMLNAGGFAGSFLAYLAMAFVFGLLVNVLGIHNFGGGLLLGALLWLGFVASTGLTVNLFSPRPLLGWAIDAGFQLLFMLLTGALLGAWRSPA